MAISVGDGCMGSRIMIVLENVSNLGNLGLGQNNVIRQRAHRVLIKIAALICCCWAVPSVAGPAKILQSHWSVAAISEFDRSGLIPGVSKSLRLPMTRTEMARLTARALDRARVNNWLCRYVSIRNIALIALLSREYSNDFQSVQVRHETIDLTLCELAYSACIFRVTSNSWLELCAVRFPPRPEPTYCFGRPPKRIFHANFSDPAKTTFTSELVTPIPVAH